MSKQAWKKFVLSILTTALMVAFVGAFTQKTSKKDSPPSVKLKDVLEKTAKNSVRLKDTGKFELIVESDGKFAVHEKSTRRLIGRLGCGVCPGNASNSGGNCRGSILGSNRGDCRGCGQSPNDFCTMDAF